MQIADYYEASFEVDLWEEVYHANGFTHPFWPVIGQKNPRELQMARWGLVPKKSLGSMDTQVTKHLNARCETVFEKPSFRNAIRQHRCLVPSTGFIEWRTWYGAKIPYYVYLCRQDLFSIAGILEEHLDTDTGEVYLTMALLTTPANRVMETIHNTKKRMPLILPRDLEQKWLDSTLSEREIKLCALPYQDEEMQFHTISKRVASNVDPFDKHILEQVSYPELSIQTLF